MMLGHLLFLGLFILALLHWRERVVHVDSALQIFKWVQNGGVEVEAHRYTAVLPQLVVKLFRLMGAPLPMLLATASAMHVLVSWSIYALAAHMLRVPWVAAAAAMAAVLCTRLTFYGIVLEANYLTSYPFLLAAVVAGPLVQGTRGSMALAMAALLMVLLVHPLGFLVAGYVLLVLALTHPSVRIACVALAGVALLWGIVGRSLLPPSGYESGLYDAALKGWGDPASWSASPALDFLVRHSWRDTALYLPAWALLALTIVVLLGRRAWHLAIVVGAGSVGLVMLNIVTYQQGETAMMMEKNFLPLAALIALPLMHEVARRHPRTRVAAFLGFALVLFVQFRVISFASRPVGERYAAIERLVHDQRELGVTKAIVPPDELSRRGIGVTWALPFETLLVSALEGREQQVTAVSADHASGIERTTGLYLMPWTMDLPLDRLDGRYFIPAEGPYRYLHQRDR